MQRWQKIKQVIASHQRFVISAHVNPDHDALGSELALCYILRAMGKDVTIINSSPVSDDCRFLVKNPDDVQRFNARRHARLIEGCDVIIMLDLSKWGRLGAVAEYFQKSPALKICIDHHLNPDPIGDYTVLDTGSSSTGELVFDLMEALRVKLTPEIAEPLYACIVMDTGRFLFPNVTGRTLEVVTRLFKAGLDREFIHRHLFYNLTPKYFRLFARALSNLKLLPRHKAAYFFLDAQSMKELKARDQDTDGLCDYLRFIYNVELGIFLKPAPGGKIKVALRGRDRADAWRLATALGGGGHHHSAAAVIDGPMKRAVSQVVRTLKKQRKND